MIQGNKECLICGKVFCKSRTESKNSWSNRRKYCSKKCRDEAKKGRYFRTKAENTTVIKNSYCLILIKKEGKIVSSKISLKDRDDVIKYRWRLSHHCYFVTSSRGEKGLYLHQLIFKLHNQTQWPYSRRTHEVDHINKDKLDNRPENLRLATNSQNALNRNKNSNNKSGHKGVCWVTGKKRWKAAIRIEGRDYNLGTYKNINEAIKRRKQIEDKLRIGNKEAIKFIKESKPELMNTNTSGATGVTWHKGANKWLAQIAVGKKNKYLGLFKNKQEAINARKEAEQKLYV